VQKLPLAKTLREGMDKVKRLGLMVGTLAPDFMQPGVDGKPVSLSSFRGKYVLLDFWASWCHPCREESPYLVKAFSQFKDSNFTIVSVSIDRLEDKDKWLAAIKKDGLTWTQLSELKYPGNEAAVLYNVIGIPQNFLINPEGKIIAADLRGEELITTLSNFLK
jgi:peroxiredoxin